VVLAEEEMALLRIAKLQPPLDRLILVVAQAEVLANGDKALDLAVLVALVLLSLHTQVLMLIFQL
jgi:hypothetical protein